MNADVHPLMRRMHNPDYKFGPQEQYQRGGIASHPGDYDAWLYGPLEGARELIRLTAIEDFDTCPDHAP